MGVELSALVGVEAAGALVIAECPIFVGEVQAHLATLDHPDRSRSLASAEDLSRLVAGRIHTPTAQRAADALIRRFQTQDPTVGSDHIKMCYMLRNMGAGVLALPIAHETLRILLEKISSGDPRREELAARTLASISGPELLDLPYANDLVHALLRLAQDKPSNHVQAPVHALEALFMMGPELTQRFPDVIQELKKSHFAIFRDF